MYLRKNMMLNAWLQLGLVFSIVILINTWASDRFFRLDLTQDKLYSLDMTTRSLMYKLERPLQVKVYFTDGLQAPYNNHEQIVVDTLEDLRAYSKGLMEIEVTDPTGDPELMEEARRFGLQPIQYRYKSASLTEMRKVYMGIALIYGGRQRVIPAITQTGTLEYDLARAIRALVTDEPRKTIAFSAGHGEPDLMGAQKGPLSKLKTRLNQEHNLAQFQLGGPQIIPDEVDALMVVGPQRPLSERALYQIDQFLMRGGALSVFVSNTAADIQRMKPQNIYHGLEGLLGHYGVKVNRDIVVDRIRNGVMRFPVRQGQNIVQLPVNYPLIPQATDLDQDSLLVKGLDSMLFPFSSSLEISDDLDPEEVTATVLARSSSDAGRIRGIRTIDPEAYKITPESEQKGAWPLLISMTGAWPSYYANKEIPQAPGGVQPEDEAPPKLRQSVQTRMVIAGSADFMANNAAFILNLADWLVQDESLISIRSKTIQLPSMEPVSSTKARTLKLINLLSGSILLLLLGAIRWLSRRSTGGFKEKTSP